MLDTNKCIALNPSNSPAQRRPAFPARPWFNALSPVSTTSFLYLSTSRLHPSSCPFLNWDSQSPQCLTPLSLHFFLCFRNQSFSCTCGACPFQRRRWSSEDRLGKTRPTDPCTEDVTAVPLSQRATHLSVTSVPVSSSITFSSSLTFVFLHNRP